MRSTAVPMPKKNDTENDIIYLKQALAQMMKNNISTAPENYAIWLHYVMGQNKDLVREVDNIVDNAVNFTQETSSYLHNKFIMGGRSQKVVDDAAINAQKVLMEVLKVIHD